MHLDVSTTAPPGWNEFVAAHPEASAYHTASAVEIGARAFRLPVLFLTVRDENGRIRGALPLVEQSSFLFGRFLVSLPFFTYGGILAVDDAAAASLTGAVERIGRERRVDHVELRHRLPSNGVHLPERLDKVSMLLPLPASIEVLGSSLGAKLRSQIKRAERESPEVAWGGAELIADFYKVFAATMHALGTPVYPPAFFETTLDALNGMSRIVVIRVKGAPEAAAIVVRHPNRVEVPWAAATDYAKRSGINMRMYWEMLQHSIEVGAPAFDFGRSTADSGTFKFKAQWGARPMQLHWHYWMRRGKTPPQLNTANPRYALASRMWRRIPLRLANTVGPWIVRNLP